MITDETVLKAYESEGSRRAAASLLGIPWTSYRRRFNSAKKRNVDVVGITPGYSTIDVDRVIYDLIASQEKKEQHIQRSRSQKVTISEEKPFVVALFSDLHIGNNKADYRALARDTALVRDCPFCYAISAGDHAENWIGKLGWISREQHMSLDTEHALLKWWFDQIAPSMIAVCSGNHDNRSVLTAGIDYVRQILGDAVLLYDMDQILFDLVMPKASIKFKVRHKDQYKSILNPFHGAFRDIERGDCDWDVYISGHDHKATLFGDYINHDSPKKVCRIGTYKMDDRFGKYLGYARSYGTGSGALLILPDGSIQSYSDIEVAVKCCAALR